MCIYSVRTYFPYTSHITKTREREEGEVNRLFAGELLEDGSEEGGGLGDG